MPKGRGFRSGAAPRSARGRPDARPGAGDHGGSRRRRSLRQLGCRFQGPGCGQRQKPVAVQPPWNWCGYPSHRRCCYPSQALVRLSESPVPPSGWLHRDRPCSLHGRLKPDADCGRRRGVPSPDPCARDRARLLSRDEKGHSRDEKPERFIAALELRASILRQKSISRPGSVHEPSAALQRVGRKPRRGLRGSP